MEKTLYPYYLAERHRWVFDDPATNLKAEEFMDGITTMIDRIVAHKGLPAARSGFSMTFSGSAFSGHDAMLTLLHPPLTSGNWYGGDIVGEWMAGWLCPALYKYFEGAPARIFVRCEPLPAGVNPIWDNRPGDGMRFVGPEAEGGPPPAEVPCRWCIPAQPPV